MSELRLYFVRDTKAGGGAYAYGFFTEPPCLDTDGVWDSPSREPWSEEEPTDMNVGHRLRQELDFGQCKVFELVEVTE
jgi:hypothetical protein